MTAIWWIRRDIRLSDNPALRAALQHATVIPLFILDPHLLSRTPQRRQHFLFGGLRQLDEALRQRGSALVIRHGNPLTILTDLIQASASPAAIYAEEDFSPYARHRDAQIARELPLTLIHGQTVHHPLAVVKANGAPYTIFTPFSRMWKSLLPPSLEDRKSVV